MTKVICFDLRCLQIGHESRGIGMHVRSMLENLDATGKYKYLFYAYDSSDPIQTLGINLPVDYTLVQTKTLKKSIDRPQDFVQLAKVIFHKFSPLRGGDIDVFVQFDFMLGLPSLKNIKRTVLVAYDLIPLIFREEYIPTPRQAFRATVGTPSRIKKVLRAMYYNERYRLHYKNFAKADLLLSISRNTTDSLVEILNIPKEKITTIPLAPVFNTVKAMRPQGYTSDSPFIFYIGATDARKRVADLVKAFDQVRATHSITLVLAGKEFAKRNKIPNEEIINALRSSPYQSNIVTIGYVSDAEKLWLYENAKAFVFPTAYEGFGLPIIEAMQHGCPVISYDNSSIPEVAGDATLLVPTGDVARLAKGVAKVLDSTVLRDRMVARGYTLSEEYTWDKYMKKFYAALEAKE